MPPPLFITKASGEQEPFSEEKLRTSLTRAQVPPAIINEVAVQVTHELRPGLSTTDIYRYAFKILKRYEPALAGRYNLKQAIINLGPTGHPFERFVGELFKAQGFTEVQVGVMVKGACVTHEVDVIAHKGDRHLMVECKFHNQLGLKSDVKTALYVQARFEDIAKQWQRNPADAHHFHEAWLITNTKLTLDAIQYGRCAGLHVVGWSYPPETSLQRMIEGTGLHPLTCLTGITKAQQQNLLSQGLVLCKDIAAQPNVLPSLNLSPTQQQRILQEVASLCQIDK